MAHQRNIEALIALLSDRADRPYAWGRERNDCLGLVCAAVKVQTGIDPLPGRSWSSELGGIRLLHALAADAAGGYVPLKLCVETVLDARLKRVPPAQAMRGDIAGVRAEAAGADPRFGLHPMIVEGVTLCSPGPRKLLRLPRGAMTVAWSAVDWAGHE